MSPTIRSILTLLLWIIMSIVPGLGIFGEIMYRKINNISLQKHWYTYIISIIPIIGPCISYIIIEG